MTTYTLGYSNAKFHGSSGANNTPEPVKIAALAQAQFDAIGTDITALQGYGRLVFAKGITAEDTSTGATAGATETAFTNQVTIPADLLAANDRIRINGKVRATAANGSDTLALKLVIANNADLKTTAITVAAVAAADSTANDEFVFSAELRVKAIGAAATATVNGHGTAIKLGAATWQNATSIADVTTCGTTSAIYCGVTYTYNASSAGNTSVIKECFVEVIRPSA